MDLAVNHHQTAKRCRRTLQLLLVCAAFLLVAAPAWGRSSRRGRGRATQQQSLVNANFSQRTDSQGFQWQIQQYGQMYNCNNLFHQACQLYVNNNNFHCNQPMMTADGSEYVLNGQASNLQVTRRILIDTKRAAVRYLEIIHNTTGGDLQANIRLNTHMRMQMQSVLGDSGGAVMGQLPDTENGILLRSQPQYNRPSVLMVLSSPKNKIRPVIQNNNNYQYQIHYNVTIPAGDSAVLMHIIAQRNTANTGGKNAMKKLFKPLLARSWMSGIPAELRKKLVNVSARGGFSMAGINLAASLEQLGLERGADDALGIGEDVAVRGAFTCKDVHIASPLGERTVPFTQVAAIVGHGGGREAGQLFLRDGQILSGEVSFEKMRFQTPLGASMDLNPHTLDRLVTHEEAEDLIPSTAVRGYVVLRNGNRLALGEGEEQDLNLLTVWGQRNVPISEVKQLAAVCDEKNGVGYRIGLKDGSHFFCYLRNQQIDVNTLLFGKMELAPAEVRTIAADLKVSKEEDGPVADDPEIRRPYVQLIDDSLLVGQVEQAEFKLQTASGVFTVMRDQCRALRNLAADDPESNEPPVFETELWDGSVIIGKLMQPLLTLETGGGKLRIPLSDLAALHIPVAVVPPALRQKVATLIRQLGDADWKKREEASAKLVGLGAVIRQQLESASRLAKDPEIQHRLQSVLDELPE